MANLFTTTSGNFDDLFADPEKLSLLNAISQSEYLDRGGFGDAFLPSSALFHRHSTREAIGFLKSRYMPLEDVMALAKLQETQHLPYANGFVRTLFLGAGSNVESNIREVSANIQQNLSENRLSVTFCSDNSHWTLLIIIPSIEPAAILVDSRYLFHPSNDIEDIKVPLAPSNVAALVASIPHKMTVFLDTQVLAHCGAHVCVAYAHLLQFLGTEVRNQALLAEAHNLDAILTLVDNPPLRLDTNKEFATRLEEISTGRYKDLIALSQQQVIITALGERLTLPPLEELQQATTETTTAFAQYQRYMTLLQTKRTSLLEIAASTRLQLAHAFPLADITTEVKRWHQTTTRDVGQLESLRYQAMLELFNSMPRPSPEQLLMSEPIATTTQPTQIKPEKIVYLSFDYDGCSNSFNHEFCYRQGIRYLILRGALIAQVQQDIADADKVVVLIGSLRQSQTADQRGMLLNGNGSCFAELHKVCHSPIFEDLRAGKAWEFRSDFVTFLVDENKSPLWNRQLKEVAKHKKPHQTISFIIYEDRQDLILEAKENLTVPPEIDVTFHRFCDEQGFLQKSTYMPSQSEYFDTEMSGIWEEHFDFLLQHINCAGQTPEALIHQLKIARDILEITGRTIDATATLNSIKVATLIALMEISARNLPAEGVLIAQQQAQQKLTAAADLARRQQAATEDLARQQQEEYELQQALQNSLADMTATTPAATTTPNHAFSCSKCNNGYDDARYKFCAVCGNSLVNKSSCLPQSEATTSSSILRFSEQTSGVQVTTSTTDAVAATPSSSIAHF